MNLFKKIKQAFTKPELSLEEQLQELEEQLQESERRHQEVIEAVNHLYDLDNNNEDINIDVLVSEALRPL